MTDWISVDDRLPELGRHVLVSRKLNNETWAEPCISFVFEKQGFPDRGQLRWAGAGADVWMPLPEPPEVE